MLADFMALEEKSYCTYKDISISIGSWNIDANKPQDVRASNVDVFGEWIKMQEDPDVIVFGFQELVDLESRRVAAMKLLGKDKKREQSSIDNDFRLWEDESKRVISQHLPGKHYKRIDCRQLVGIFLCVYVREYAGLTVSMAASSTAKTGLAGYHGNKGGIATRLVVNDTSLCFVNCHLAAHQKEIIARNLDCLTILKKADFEPVNGAHCFIMGNTGSQVMDHEIVFWFGDMNYRIDSDRKTVMEAINKRDWRSLRHCDQLIKQFNTNPNFALEDFEEAKIDFAPTFKYDVGTQHYDTSEKQRIPAWCDRMLWRGQVQMKVFKRFESTMSDHRPIGGAFIAPVKSIDPDKYAQVEHQAMLKWTEIRAEMLKNIIFPST